jgi:uncharacterized protein (DUF1800 family)
MAARSSTLIAACCVAALASSGAARADSAAVRQIIHVLNRIAFGPTAQDMDHVRRVGIDRYIAEQLDPDAIAQPPALTERLAPLDRLNLDSAELFKRYGPLSTEANGGVPPTPEQVEARIKQADAILQQAAAARIYRALYSPRQLQEVMVDFWFNRFNVFAYKGFDLLWIGDYEARAIRPYALGRFRDLLLATARHPAMIYYLDSQTSTAPDSPNARGEFAGLNENYARELMELQTLGVDGGYTQDDVVTLARIFTGWGFDYAHMDAGSGSAEGFDPSRHDRSDKIFLGQKIRGGDEDEGVQAIDILARSPATARHIAFELAQYFVADQPAPALVDRLAQRFGATDGDIKAVMESLLTSPEFHDSAGQKYKTPYQYVLSAVRAGGVEVRNPEPLLGTMSRLGMPLYLCQTPDGYKNTEEAWLSPDATTLRINFASLLTSGAYLLYVPPSESRQAANPMAASHLVADAAPAAGLKPKPIDPAALENLLSPTLGERTRETVAAAPDWLKASLILGSPDFMRR